MGGVVLLEEKWGLLSRFVDVLIFFGVVYLNNLGGVLFILVGDDGSCDDLMGEADVVVFIRLYGEAGVFLRGLGSMLGSYPFDSYSSYIYGVIDIQSYIGLQVSLL